MKGCAVEGLTAEIVELDGRTPTLLVEIPAFGDDASDAQVLMYGHLDKQPEVTGWDENKGPWKPVVEDGKLYGRGAADDGYAVFGSLCAIEALQAQGASHPRVTVLIETSEESGSPDLAAYVEHLSARLGSPDLVVCLDSGAGDYERMWLCTSLRGNVTGDLRISTVTEGIHSGDASGIVPSSFRVARILLDRIEDAATGEIVLDALRAAVPDDRMSQARAAADVLGEGVHDKYPFQAGARPMGEDGVTRILARTWAATLSVTGADGMPSLADAGNVLRPETALKLSFRLAPTTDPDAACRAVAETLESDPPYGASVRFENADAATGWNAPPFAPWLDEAIQESSRTFFGKDAVSLGEGGDDPAHGPPGGVLPRGAVRDHRRPRPGLERPRAERAPAPRHGGDHGLRGDDRVARLSTGARPPRRSVDRRGSWRGLAPRTFDPVETFSLHRRAARRDRAVGRGGRIPRGLRAARRSAGRQR